MPLQRRLPKRGFTNIFKIDYQEVNIGALGVLSDTEITPEALRLKGLASRKKMPIKILGMGEIERAVKVKAHAFSQSAREKIEKAGGTIEVISFKAPGRKIPVGTADKKD